jgi:transposase
LQVQDTVGKSPLTTTDEQRAALAMLAGSRDRGEADRARAMLLTLVGWTSPRIAEAFGLREDTVRLWRSDFAGGGIEALKASVTPGPTPLKSETSLRAVAPLLEQPMADRRNWTTSKLATAALAARAHWLAVEWLPKYAPEINDIEVDWHDLKAHHLTHQTFADSDALDRAIHQAVDELNAERAALPLAEPRISAQLPVPNAHATPARAEGTGRGLRRVDRSRHGRVGPVDRGQLTVATQMTVVPRSGTNRFSPPPANLPKTKRSRRIS